MFEFVHFPNFPLFTCALSKIEIDSAMSNVAWSIIMDQMEPIDK